jgi:hypothetical protein
VTPEQITSFFASLIAIAKEISVDFVMNIEMMEHQDWADGQEQHCEGSNTIQEDEGSGLVSRVFLGRIPLSNQG